VRLLPNGCADGINTVSNSLSSDMLVDGDEAIDLEKAGDFRGCNVLGAAPTRRYTCIGVKEYVPVVPDLSKVSLAIEQ
jgi:hypothetical protein